MARKKTEAEMASEKRIADRKAAKALETQRLEDERLAKQLEEMNRPRGSRSSNEDTKTQEAGAGAQIPPASAPSIPLTLRSPGDQGDNQQEKPPQTQRKSKSRLKNVAPEAQLPIQPLGFMASALQDPATATTTTNAATSTTTATSVPTSVPVVNNTQVIATSQSTEAVTTSVTAARPAVPVVNAMRYMRGSLTGTSSRGAILNNFNVARGTTKTSSTGYDPHQNVEEQDREHQYDHSRHEDMRAYIIGKKKPNLPASFPNPAYISSSSLPTPPQEDGFDEGEYPFHEYVLEEDQAAHEYIHRHKYDEGSDDEETDPTRASRKRSRDADGQPDNSPSDSSSTSSEESIHSSEVDQRSDQSLAEDDDNEALRIKVVANYNKLKQIRKDAMAWERRLQTAHGRMARIRQQRDNAERKLELSEEHRARAESRLAYEEHQREQLQDTLRTVTDAYTSIGQAVPAPLAQGQYNLTVQSSQDLEQLQSLDPANITRFLNQFRPGMILKPVELMSSDVAELLDEFITATCGLAPNGEPYNFRRWSTVDFVQWMRKALQSDASNVERPLLERIKTWEVRQDLQNLSILHRCMVNLIQLEKQAQRQDLADHERSAVEYLIKNQLAKSNDGILRHAAEQLGLHDNALRPHTLRDFRIRLQASVHEATVAITAATRYGISMKTMREATRTTSSTSQNSRTNYGSPNKKGKFSYQGSNKIPSNPQKQQRTSAAPRPSRQSECHHCGRDHKGEPCAFIEPDGSSYHPDCNNKAGMPTWSETDIARHFNAKFNSKYLPFNIDSKGNHLIVPQSVRDRIPESKKPPTSPSKPSGSKSKSLVTAYSSSLHLTNSNDFISCHISKHLQSTPSLSVNCLLDSGSLGVAGNYVSLDTAKALKALGAKHQVVSQSVASAFDNIDFVSKTLIICNVILNTESTPKTELRFQISAYEVDTNIDLILGRETIKTFDLTTKFPSQFQIIPSTSIGDHDPKVDNVLLQGEACGCMPKVLTAMRLRNLTDSKISPNATDFEWHAPAFEAFESVIDPTQETEDALQYVTILADEELTESNIRLLLEEFREIFQENLPAEPAKVPPMDLVVDKTKWEHPKHKLPQRPQTPANQAEISAQLERLQAQNIVRPSTAAFYSQVHLAEKPPKGSGKKRFCIDYILLNLCTSAADNWPLPNIQQMLRRLGQHRPKYIAVFDLTAGYHQIPMSIAAIVFTAFICFSGIYEYLRVPFGLKGAPSYFQRVMANVVLAGLIYTICEVYIDDIIVHAQTADEFLIRIRRVFERIQKHGLVLHPKKARIGLRSVEYTGHVIDSSGISFSREKIQTLLDFPVPTTKKALKSFLGMANYFRDHIRDHSTVVATLQRYINKYTKREGNKPILLDEEGVTAFNTIKSRIEQCPKLFFMNDTSPIVLFTDASDYGIGGYLIQVGTTPDGKDKEIPIAFMSASLQGGQLNWETPQKECFAIYKAIMKFQYLLRDRHFTIKTDHKNITWLNNTDLSSIRKWKIFFSEFDYEFSYIKGEANTIADALSRLVANEKPQDSESLLLATLPGQAHIPPKEYNIIRKVHNSTSGHHGVERTLHKLLRYCQSEDISPWQLIRQHVRLFIKQCPCCQKMAMLKTPIAAHPFTVSSYNPMERLQMDFIGPFPDDKYILVIICCFTRWVELYLCDAATAEQACAKLLEHIGRFGAPTQLLSDRGSHFVNSTINELTKLVGIDHCLNIAYSKEESAIVERANREINRHLTALFFHKGVVDDYITSIPLVQRIMNATPHGRTRVAPSKLLFGNAIDLDTGIFLPAKATKALQKAQPLSQHMTKLLSIQEELIKAAQDELRKADEAHIASANADRTEFPINSYVLLTYPNQPPTRLHPRRRGPFQIVSFHNNDYTIRDLVSNKELTVNITRLSPFNFDPLYTDPRMVSLKDQEEFQIESILAHRGNLNRKGTLEFLVRWEGYDETNDTWEPWKNLRSTIQLHKYLREKGLTKLIPAEFHQQFIPQNILNLLTSGDEH